MIAGENINAERPSRKARGRDELSLVSSWKNPSEMKHPALLLLLKPVLPSLLEKGPCTMHGRENRSLKLKNKQTRFSLSKKIKKSKHPTTKQL